jgi:hypothetical protein
MTIGVSNRNDALGNDAATVYPYGFKIFAATHLEVKVRKDDDGTITTLSYPTQYSVSGVGNRLGGNVTLASVSGAWQNTDGTLKTGYSIAIRRVVPLSQATDLRNQGDFFAETHEDAFDYAMMVNQQQADDLDRAVKLDSSYDPDDFDMTLPDPVANMAIGFDSAGTGLALIASLSGAATTAFTLSLLDDASGDAFMDTLTAAMTAETAPAVGDRLILDDISAGTWDTITLANLFKVINGFTGKTTPLADDEVALYSAADSDIRKSTLRNVMKVINDLVAYTKPVRTTDLVSIYDAATGAAKKVLLDNLPLPRSYLAGLAIANNAGDATNDIDIAVGACRSLADTDNILLASALTKQLDAAWAVGTNQGMRATGAAIANGTYHIFAIKRPDTGVVDIAADTSVTGANIAANTNAAYTEVRRIASILREGGAIVGFVQDGDYFRRKATIQEVAATNPGTSAVTATLAGVPTGLNLLADFSASWGGSAATTGYMFFSDLAANDEAAGAGRAHLYSSANGASSFGPQAGQFSIRTNTSAQIRYRASGSDGSLTLFIHTNGWIDTRGRNE